MIKRISHIGIVVENREAAQQFWGQALGLKKFNELEIAVEGIRSVFLSVGGSREEMTIELMEPMDKSDMNNAVARRLANRGEGFYHLAVEVDDIQGSGQALTRRGMTLIDRPGVDEQAAPRWLVHPRDANGVMVEGLIW